MDLLGQLEFRHPWLLLSCLAFIPVYLLSRRAPGSLSFSSLDLLPRAATSWRMRFSWVPDALAAIACILLGIALAGPRTGDDRSKVRREGIAIMMVVDTSCSMQALDLSLEDRERTRLDAVKDVFEKFVAGGSGLKGRPDDAIGLVSFAGYADSSCPLTLDHSNLLTVAQSLSIVTDRNEDGTAIGDGLGLAVERLRESPARSRVAILLTDGVNNSGIETPLAAAELAKSQGVKVHTIGAGTNGIAPVRVTDPFSGKQVLQPMRVEIDEGTLREIAERTGGHYFRATDAESLLEIYEEIDRLERTEIVEERFRQYHEHYGEALAAGMLLACLGFAARSTAFRRLP